MQGVAAVSPVVASMPVLVTHPSWEGRKEVLDSLSEEAFTDYIASRRITVKKSAHRI